MHSHNKVSQQPAAVTMSDEFAEYGVPCLQPPCKVSKLKTSKDDTDHGLDETAIETQFLQHKTKGILIIIMLPT